MNKKFQKIFSVSVFQISLAGILVSIGIVSDSFIRINNLTFITMTIYIIIGMILPLWLGILSAILIDTFQLILRGLNRILILVDANRSTNNCNFSFFY